MPNIAIIWDFDGTLTPDDSTTITVQTIDPNQNAETFWGFVHDLRGDKSLETWEHILAMDAPIWMYALSRLAFVAKVPLNKEFFQKFVLPKIELFSGVDKFLRAIKSLEKKKLFKKQKIEIHHFIVSAGLKDLIELVFPEGLIKFTYGCRYTIGSHPEYKDEPESVPVFCMDETAKTRAIIEISKGSFEDRELHVNTKVDKKWAEFADIIYIGDGETDIPSLALTRERGGTGIVLFDPKKGKKKIEDRLKKIRGDKRADLITEANFSLKGELFQYIVTKCNQIRQRYEAS